MLMFTMLFGPDRVTARHKHAKPEVGYTTVRLCKSLLAALCTGRRRNHRGFFFNRAVLFFLFEQISRRKLRDDNNRVTAPVDNRRTGMTTQVDNLTVKPVNMDLTVTNLNMKQADKMDLTKAYKCKVRTVLFASDGSL